MRLDLTQNLRLEQRMKLAPLMIQSMEILQLPLLALQERINQELVENPVLEVRPQRDEDAEDQPKKDEADTDADVPATVDEDFSKLDRMGDEWERYIDDPIPGPRIRRAAGERDRKLEAMQNTAAPGVSLQDFLEQQVGLLDLDDGLQDAVHHIIWNIDDNGYLRFSLEEIAASMDGHGDLGLAEQALMLVQSLDPPGVGAKDLRECLLLQLDRLGVPPGVLVRRLIEDHLHDIEENRLPHIAKVLETTIDEVKAGIAAVSHLNPRPGGTYFNRTTHYVQPDVIVEATDTGYEVHLEDNWTPHLYISRGYRNLARKKDVDTRTREFVNAKIRSARWLIDAIEQRRTTLLAVARSIVAFQTDFLDNGPGHLKPLKMQEVADDVGVHVSTVSRAVSGKYMQTPRGIHDMKSFFTGGTQTEDGTETSWQTVKDRIEQLVDDEDKSSPKSDEELAEDLRKEGYEVARRTVTKYRKMLNIPSSRKRREY